MDLSKTNYCCESFNFSSMISFLSISNDGHIKMPCEALIASFFSVLEVQVYFEIDLNRPFQKTALHFHLYSSHTAGTKFDAMKESKRPNHV